MQLPLHVKHSEASGGSIPTFVLLVDRRAYPGLVHSLAGQDAISQGEGMPAGQFLEHARTLAADIVVV